MAHKRSQITVALIVASYWRNLSQHRSESIVVGVSNTTKNKETPHPKVRGNFVWASFVLLALDSHMGNPRWRIRYQRQVLSMSSVTDQRTLILQDQALDPFREDRIGGS